MPTESCRITVVAAIARNGVIGNGNALPWRLPEDLQHFKALTMGHPIVMGRKTFRSLPRLLPRRSHIVVSHDVNLPAAGAIVVDSMSAAIHRGKDCPGSDEIFVIGGAEIYSLALPLAQRLQLTEIHADFVGDVFFPAFERDHWLESARSEQKSTNDLAFAYVTYDRNIDP